MIPRLETHQIAALAIFLLVALWASVRDGFSAALPGHIVLALLLVPILSYRLIAWLSSFGWPEYLAWDFGSENRPGPYAFFFWMLFLLACAFRVLNWRLI